MRCRLILSISEHPIQQGIRIEGGPLSVTEKEKKKKDWSWSILGGQISAGPVTFATLNHWMNINLFAEVTLPVPMFFHQFISKSVFEDTIWLQNLLCNAVEFGAAGVLIRDRVTSGGSSRSSSQPPTLHWLNIIAFKPDDLKSSSYHPLWHPKKIFTTRLRTNMQNSDKVYSLEYDTDMLPGSQPHRKYMVRMV